MLILRQLLPRVALAILGLILIYAYLVRIERRVIGGLQLRGQARWGILWPVVDTVRALVKPTAGGIRPGARRFIGQGFAFGATLAALLLLSPGTADAWTSTCLWGPEVGPRTSLPVLFIFNWLPLLGMLLALDERAPRLYGRNEQALHQSLAYALPAMLAALGPVLLSDTLYLRDLVEQQCAGQPLALQQPLGFAVFALSLFASRHLPSRETEGGYPEDPLLVDFHLQHASRVAAFDHLIDYFHLLFVSTSSAVLYLGGGCGPWRNGLHWLLLKSLMLALLLLWLRINGNSNKY